MQVMVLPGSMYRWQYRRAAKVVVGVNSFVRCIIHNYYEVSMPSLLIKSTIKSGTQCSISYQTHLIAVFRLVHLGMAKSFALYTPTSYIDNTINFCCSLHIPKF